MRRIAVVLMLVSASVLAGGGATAPPAAGDTDDSWVVFATDDGGIATSHPDGRNTRQITTRPSAPLGPTGEPFVHREPDLSPDGRQVAFLSCSPSFGNPLRPCQLWAVAFDGSNLRRVPTRAENDAQLTRVSWSPDNGRLAVSWRTASGGAAVSVVNVDGTAERVVAFGESADWAPDGQRLVYWSRDGLRVLHLADGSTRLVTSPGGNASWSPDGQRIAFAREIGTAPHTQWHHAVVHPDGGGLRILGDALGTWAPHWGPDSRTLAVVSAGRVLATAVLDLAGTVVGRHPSIVTGWANPSGIVPCKTGSWLAARDGGVHALGTATFHGSLGGVRLNAPVAGVAAAPAGDGYWLLGGDGGVFTFGPGARFFGSTGDRRLNAPVLAMSVTTTGAGYWLVAGDGGIFTFGDAPFFGSTGDRRLNQPVVALATTPTGKGYWLVAKDGGIFTFGDAAFFGSTGDLTLTSPIVAMVPTTTGKGYWLIAADGGTFDFGDTTFLGSAAAYPGLGSPVVSAAAPRNGGGFTMATADGQAVPFGDAEFCGSRFGATRLPSGAIVGIAA